MARLTISMLGPLRVSRDGQPISEPTYAKVLALLAYLAVERDRPHQRSAIAGLLWPDQTEERARHSLRQALTTLRRVVGHDADPPCLTVSRDTIALNGDADIDVDVTTLTGLLATRDAHDHADLATCPSCTQWLERATSLYTGEFLQGFTIPDSDSFEAWAQMWRMRLHDGVARALDDLASCHERQGNADAAVRALRRLLELDPWLEPAHRRLMLLLWQGGNRAAAMAQYERCVRLLDEELGVPPEEETTALFTRIRDGAPAPASTPPPAERGDAPRTRLPATTTRLVGREREMDDITALLSRQDCRLLTLIGPGGCGKTRLALEVATDRARRATGTICFVPLASVRRPDGIALAIASALDLARDGARAEDQLRDWLQDRDVFLVLDNAEHLIHRMDLVTDLVASAPRLTVLVTSRERLNLAGEWVYEIGGMTVPRSDHADSFEGYDAIELFGERLRQVRSGIPLRHEERPDVVRICQLVDGMPLALELAAAWANTLALADIAEGIRTNLDFLSASTRDAPDRHTSMRAVFTSSWNLLNLDQQAAFRRLSVFEDGFLLDAAESITGTSVPTLAALINKSLLTRLPNGRYRFHSLLGQFGDELLQTEPEEYQRYHDRHARYYLRMLAGLERDLGGASQRDALQAVDDDNGNVRAAWRWAVEHGMLRELTDAMPACWLSFVIRGWMREGESTFGRLLDALRSRNGHWNGDAAELRHATLVAQISCGGFRSGLGRYDEGIAMIGEALPPLRELVRGRGIGLALNMLAAAWSMKGDYARARDLLRESLAEFERVHDIWGMAYSLNDLGMISHRQFGDADASDHCERSRVMFRMVGDSRGRAFAASNLAVMATSRGDYRQAERLHREALALREASDDRWGVAASLVHLGAVHRLAGTPDTARDPLLRALRIARESSVVPVVLDALVELAEVDVATGHHDRAESTLAAIAAHPALPGETRARVEELLREVAGGMPDVAAVPGAGGWAVRTVDDLARALIGAA